MDIQEIKRLNTSVAFLQDGQSFKVDDFVLGTINPNTIFVNCYSTYQYLESINKEKAFTELGECKSNFINISANAKEFSQFCIGKSIRYNLVIDTGGGGVTICSEEDGKWEYLM